MLLLKEVNNRFLKFELA